MPTILLKSITRESTEVIDEKEIIITLTDDQKIELKLKGKRGNGQSIGIKELYNYLNGNENKDGNGSITIKADVDKRQSEDKMISLKSLRSHNAISTLDIVTLAKFDQIITSLLEEY